MLFIGMGHFNILQDINISRLNVKDRFQFLIGIDRLQQN